MGTARKLILILSNFLLVISIVVFVGSFSLVGIIGNKEQTTQVITESGLYGVIAQNARKQLIQSTPVLDQVPDTFVDAALSKAINDQSVQKIGEPVINGIYTWLDGNQNNPDIKIDLKPIQNTFAESIAAQLLARASKLPQCLPGQFPNTTDITSIDCIPRGFSIKPAIAQIKKVIQNANTDTFNNNVSLEEFSESGQSQISPIESLKKVRQYYQATKTARIVALISAGIALVLMLILSSPRLKVTKNLGIIFTVFGIIYTLTGLIIPPVTKTAVKNLADKVADNSFKAPLEKILHELATISGNYILKCGLVMILIGVALLLVYKLIVKKNPTSQSISQDTAQGNNDRTQVP